MIHGEHGEQGEHGEHGEHGKHEEELREECCALMASQMNESQTEMFALIDALPDSNLIV